ncbi:hypothetical protein TNIN_281181 [Trichonephila inaurata madagascariensis]|uniref:Uncharacterized protein n=1 Tax=Trichonephila inaurata madagascariensis TaxID=2747483 RepID=A0A8X6YNW1_9ARAC|nr:hypothetical protein TNIN_281181 [Trichonephila inaurata madagascariensis]
MGKLEEGSSMIEMSINLTPRTVSFLGYRQHLKRMECATSALEDVVLAMGPPPSRKDLYIAISPKRNLIRSDCKSMSSHRRSNISEFCKKL